jgi:predicted type IV restriction endonuclease
MDTMVMCIEGLQAKLEKHRKDDLKETPTRVIFTDVLLQALGWDVRNPDEVELECPTIDGKSVDYALKVDCKPVLFVEAKPLNDPLTDVKAITQVVGYAANAGVEWCVLTNGVTYKVYHSTEKAEAPEKLLFEVSIDPKENKGMTASQIAERLSRFSRDSMTRGVLDEIGKETFTMGKIRKALDKMFAEPPNTLVRLVRSTIGDDTIKPAQVRKALTRLWARTSEVEITPLSTLSVLPATIETVKPGGKNSIRKGAQPPGIIEGVDTIVVPAQEDGFQEVFVGENRWYAIRMHTSMIPRIKYIAAYRVAPISAVTHWALVKNIEPWQNTGKFVVNFTEPAKELEHIKLVPKSRVKAPQAPRYASFSRLQQAKTLNDLF